MNGRRIVFFLPDLGLGGAQRVAATLAGRLRDRGDSVTLATLGPTHNDHVEVPSGVERWAIDPSVRRPGPVGVVVKNLQRVRRVRARFRARRPDVVIAFVDSTNLFALLATRGLGIPVIVSERVDPREHRIPVAQRLLRRLLYPRAAAVVVQTERVAGWARGVTRQRRVHVIPNPVPVPSRPRSEETPLAIVAAGRLVPQKGFDLLVEALASMRPTEEVSWRCEILGEGPQRAELEGLVRSTGLTGRIELPGRVDDVEQRFSRAAVFVLSSRFEGFPNALTEAMALGLPCVAFDCPTGPRELLIDGQNGRLVPAEDVGSLRTAIRDLLISPGQRHSLGAAARRSVAALDPESVTDRWNDLLSEVTA